MLIMAFLFFLLFNVLFFESYHGASPLMRRSGSHGGCDMPPPHPVDAVFSWVNGSDTLFQESLLVHLPEEQKANNKRGYGTLQNRFRDLGQLKYSLRSIEKYAPWINQIWLVVSHKSPSWLNTTYPDSSNPRVRIAYHIDIFPNSDLPTFNSNAIEANMHKIPGLSKEFLYFNDDLSLTKTICYSDFWTKESGYIMRTTGNLPAPHNMNCPKKCTDRRNFNDTATSAACDNECNTVGCLYDGGRCDMEILSGDSYWKSRDFNYMLFHKFMRKDRIYGVHHIPLLVNTHIMEELQHFFKRFYEATSRHRIRTHNDIQFQTMYTNWVLVGGYKSTESRDSDVIFFEISKPKAEGIYKIFQRVKTAPKTFLSINDKLEGDAPDIARNLTAFYNDVYTDKAGFENA